MQFLVPVKGIDLHGESSPAGLESVASPSSVTPDKGKSHGPKKAMPTINIKLH